jgi:hypothetical protein
VYENVFFRLIVHDEAEAFALVKELYYASLHNCKKEKIKKTKKTLFYKKWQTGY